MKKLSLLIIALSMISCDDTTTTADACGDGILDPGEQCDSGIADNTCFLLGYYNPNGELGCNANCTFDTSDCGGWCGDSVIEAEQGEVCDNTLLNQQTCLLRGYYGGELACAADCLTFDESDCATFGRCGDGLAQTGQDEVCDGADLNGQTCEGLGYYGGALACNTNCGSFELSGCETAGRCGDDTAQTGSGELCDGADLAGQTCETLGYHGGILECLADCSDFNPIPCIEVGRCGDNNVQAAYGEQCDGTDLEGATCETLGYYGGTLACTAECLLDQSACESAGQCGDGTIQSIYEECDGDNLDGQTCTTLGYYPGTLACAACQLDDTGCGGSCGDGTVQASYEDCDGTDFGTNTCRTENYFTGPLACATATCTSDISGCLNILELASGGYHTCAILTDGTVRCWGYNNNGQLGDNTLTNRTTPVQVLNLTSANKITAGRFHTCVRLDDGTVRCWGYNSTGQLGDNTTTSRRLPVTVSNLSGVTNLDAGAFHTCAVKSDGTAWCWGDNGSGRLGDGTTTNRLTRVQVSGLTTVAEITGGSDFTCAEMTNASIRCWGENMYGQLGDGTTTDRLTPITPTLSNVSNISAGGGFVCATTSGGMPITKNAYCWGQNTYGQLGDGTTTNRLVPTPISYTFSSTTAYRIHAGGDHACLSSGFGGTYNYATCWGYNNNGQLGNNTTTNSSVPVNAGTRATTMSLGDGHSCALTGTTLNIIRCWGDNYYGQLGDGTMTDRWTYVNVLP